VWVPVQVSGGGAPVNGECINSPSNYGVGLWVSVVSSFIMGYEAAPWLKTIEQSDGKGGVYDGKDLKKWYLLS